MTKLFTGWVKEDVGFSVEAISRALRVLLLGFVLGRLAAYVRIPGRAVTVL